MATYTAGDQINRALRLLGVLAEGETPSASTSSDALMALNQMIDSWSTERLSVFATMDQTFTWPGGERTQTLGPVGADFNGVRPITLDSSTYYKYGNLSYVPDIINQEQYNSIVLKTSESNIPQVLFVNESYPNIEMALWPVPSQDLVWHFISVDPLTEPAALATVLSFPPGYLRAFAYNLACELAPEFGVSAPADVKRIAASSKRNLKRINNPEDLMSMPGPLVATNYPGGNIYTGWM